MGIKITDATPLASSAGDELIPVSSAGAARTLTPAMIAQLAISFMDSGVITNADPAVGTDEVFLRRSEQLQKVTAAILAAYVRDWLFGHGTVHPVAHYDVIPLTRSGVSQKATVASLSAYIEAAVLAAVYNVTGLDTSGTLVDADTMLVTQGTTGKKATIAAITAKVMAGLSTYVGAATTASAPSTTDIFFVNRGGFPHKVYYSAIEAALGGGTVAPATTTEHKVPQWDMTQKALKDGLTLRQTVRDAATVDHLSLVTEKAARDFTTGYVDALHQNELSADPADPAEGKHIIWQSDGTGSGDDGDIMIKITAGGVTKTATLVDFSGIA